MSRIRFRLLLAALLLAASAVASAADRQSASKHPTPAQSGSPTTGRETADPAPDAGIDPDPIESPAATEDDGLLLEDPILDEPPLELYLFDEEDLVEAASRKTAKLSEAPGTITLIQRSEMEDLGVLTLGDLLQYLNSSTLVPGTVDTSVLFRGVQQPFNNKILLLQDGRVLNNPYRGDFSLDLAQPLDEIQRVEVVRGPGSALYGANAFAGFINLVTMKGAEVDGIRSRTAFGGDGLWYQSVLAGAKTGDVDWLVRGRIAGTDGQDPVNPAEENNDQENIQLKSRLSGDTWFVDIGAMEVRGASPGSFAFPTSRDAYDIRQLHVDGRKVWEFGDKFKISLRAFYTDADNTYTFVSLNLPDCDGENPFCEVTESALTDQEIIDIVDPDGNRVPEDVRKGFEITLNTPGHLRVKDRLGDPDVYIDRATYDAWKAGELGDRVERQRSRERRAFTEFQFDWKVSRSNYLLMGAGVQADILRNSDVGDHTFRDYFGSLEDEQRFLDDQLILLGSVRFDSHSWFGETASPRLSLIYAPKFGDGAARLLRRSRPPFYLKAGFGKAFRSPNFVELFGQTRVGPALDVFESESSGVAFLRGNPELEQESIETYELQFHWEPARTLQTTLTLFDYSIDNEVVLNVDRDVVFALQDSRIPQPGLHDLVFDEALAVVPVSAEFINVEKGTEGHGLEFNLVWSPKRRLEGLTLWSNYSRLHLDRPVERELVIETNPESAAVIAEGFRIRREGGLQDYFNLGLRYRSRNDRWMFHYRARVTGELGTSLFTRGGRIAHDLSLGLRAGRFSATVTGLNLTGEDVLRDPTDGSYPDLDPVWNVILGYRWEF